LEVSASVRISAKSDFHGPLSAHGKWVEVGSYGRCWRPAKVAVEWRPYGYGHWVWTDCGWYWVSDEPWAWACYHYGSWVYDSDHGWIWIPGIEWAPAWVSWRVGGGYCGWAPLAPHGVVVASRSFVFVKVQRFHEPVRPSNVVVNNTIVINQTSELPRLRRETRKFDGTGPQKIMVNEGPGLAAIENATGKKLRPVSIREASQQTRVPKEVARKTSEPTSKERPHGTPEVTKPPPDRKQATKDAPDSPQKSTRPDANRQRYDDARPAPRAPTPTQPQHTKPNKSRGKGA
jgi:hypothetical protein